MVKPQDQQFSKLIAQSESFVDGPFKRNVWITPATMQKEKRTRCPMVKNG
jgi:hypothetical protein